MRLLLLVCRVIPLLVGGRGGSGIVGGGLAGGVSFGGGVGGGPVELLRLSVGRVDIIVRGLTVVGLPFVLSWSLELSIGRSSVIFVLACLDVV